MRFVTRRETLAKRARRTKSNETDGSVGISGNYYKCDVWDLILGACNILPWARENRSDVNRLSFLRLDATT